MRHFLVRRLAWVVGCAAVLIIVAAAASGWAQNSVPVISADRSTYLPPNVAADRMFIQVVDQASNTSTADETITVTITSAGTAASVTKVLGETSSAVNNGFGEIDSVNSESGDGTGNANGVGVTFTTDAFEVVDGSAGIDAVIPVTVPEDTLTIQFTNSVGNTSVRTVEVRAHTGDFSQSTASILASTSVNRDGDGNANETNGDDDNVRVVLVDADLNTDPFSRQTLTVDVLATISGQSTTLVLQESGNNTGMFLGGGVVGTSTTAPFTSAVAGDRTTSPPTSFVLGAAAQGDSIIVSYPAGAADVITDGTSAQTSFEIAYSLGVLGSLSLDAESFRLGQRMTITLTDPDLNLDPFGVDAIGRGNGDTLTDAGEVNVLVTGGNGNTEEIQLTETGLNSGVFTALLSFNFSDAGSTDNQLDAGADVSYRIEYVDANSSQAEPQAVTASAVFTPFSGAVAVAPEMVRNGSAVTITVTDHDLNTDDATVQRLTGSAAPDVTGSGGDLENNIELRETAPDSGVFTGTLLVNVSGNTPNNSDGTVDVPAAGSLTVTYTDAVNAAGQTNVNVSAAAALGQVNGQVTMSASQLGLTDTVMVTLTDPDLDTDINTVQTVSGDFLFAFSTTNANSTHPDTDADSGTAPTENDPNVFLTESGPNTGVFTGALTFTTSNLNRNGSASLPTVLEVSPGDTVTVRYQDANPSAAASTATAAVLSNTGVLTMDERITSGPVNGQSRIQVTLTEADLNTSATTQQTATVQVVSTSDSDTGITISLTETSTNSGVFTGFFSTAGNRDDTGASKDRIDASDSSQSQGVVAAANGDGVQVNYDDARNAQGQAQTIRVSQLVQFSTGSLRLLSSSETARSSFIIGESLVVIYDDPDANLDPTILEMLEAQVSSDSDRVGATLRLREATLNSGSFRGTIGLTSGTTIPNSSIQVAAGGQVMVTVSDTTPAEARFPYLPERLSSSASIVEVSPVELSPARLVVEIGQTRRLSVTGGFSVALSSSDPSTATVDGSGTVAAVAPGTVTITAEDAVSGTSATAQVIVVEAGQPLPNEAVSFTLIFPVIPGEGFFSILSMVNNTNDIAKVRLTVVQDEGGEVISPFNTIEPRSAVFDLVEGFFQDLHPGYILVESDTPLQATLSIEDAEFTSLDISRPVIPAANQVLPVVVSNIQGTDFDTTLFLVNPNDTEASVSLTVHEAGMVKGRVENTIIPPRSRILLSVNELFPASLEIGLLTSYIEVSANVDIGVAALISSEFFGMAAGETGQL